MIAHSLRKSKKVTKTHDLGFAIQRNAFLPGIGGKRFCFYALNPPNTAPAASSSKSAYVFGVANHEISYAVSCGTNVHRAYLQKAARAILPRAA